METNEKWYIRGKKGCEEQIKDELEKRGADYNVNYFLNDGVTNFNYENEAYLFYVLENVVQTIPLRTELAERIIANWQEIKIDEPKPKHTFKPYDKVLVCDGKGCCWRVDFFSHYNNNKRSIYQYVCVSSQHKNCLPYEGNEHLVGVVFDPKHIAGYDE